MKDESQSLLLRRGRVVLPDRVLERGGVLIERGRISRIVEEDTSETYGAKETHDLDGATLLPGFIDIHIHGAAGVDTMSATADDMHSVARYLAAHGTTAWLPTTVPAPDEDYLKFAREASELMRTQDERPPAARSLGAHYEGPFVNRAQCGALRTAYFREWADVRSLDFLPGMDAPNAVHIMTFAPETAGGCDLIRELTRRNWVASIGHTRADVATLDRAFAAGARHMTHFMNAMTGMHHRDVGAATWGLTRDDVTCDVIADGVHVHPLALEIILRCKTPERIVLVSDAVAPAGCGDGDYELWGGRVRVERGRTQSDAGALAGSVITVLDAVRLMLSLGVPLTHVARMASLNPARLLRLDGEYGSITEGKRADLVAIGDDGRVRLTLVGGRACESRK